MHAEDLLPWKYQFFRNSSTTVYILILDDMFQSLHLDLAQKFLKSVSMGTELPAAGK